LAESGFNVITLSVETYNQRFNGKIDFSRITHANIKSLISSIRKKGMKTETYIIALVHYSLVFDHDHIDPSPDVLSLGIYLC